MTTVAWKIKAAREAGLELRAIGGRCFFTSTDPNAFNFYEWLCAYYEQYRVLPKMTDI